MKQKTTPTNNLNKVYETDASQMKGKPSEVIIPETILEVQHAVKSHHNITARGGGTGLAGGAVPQKGLVIDLSKLNKILKFDKERFSVEVEAGIVLDDLNEFLEEHGLEFPIQPSSHEVCTIGGMIATDAVGSRAVKYGRTSKWIDWIEIIDSEGELHKKGKTELHDFAGLEGITGIIVRASLHLIEKKERTAGFLKRDTLEEILYIVKELKRNPNVCMIEFLDKKVSDLLGLGQSYHIFVEYESNEGNMRGEGYKDAILLRDKVFPLLAEHGYTRIEDPKIFVDKFPILMKWFEENEIPIYGHLSVGIIHPCFSKETEKKIPEMMKLIKRWSGQVSGEHGIGIMKKQFVEENDKKIIHLIKKRNDPSNKFNPGKMVD